MEKPDNTSASPAPTSDGHHLRDWLKRHGLKDNPFGEIDAQHEDNISAYYVPVQDLYIDSLLNRPSPWLVFAADGRGKTALRKMVASRCYPAAPDSKILALEFERRTWSALQEAVAPSFDLQPACYAQAIVRLALGQLEKALPKHWDALTPLTKAAAAAPTDVRPQSLLDQLCDRVGGLGFSHVICLVDELDNAFPDYSPETMLDWVRPLLRPEIRNYLTLRYFLPDVIDELLKRESRQLRLGSCHVTRVRWREINLIALLRERMRAFSAHPTDFYTGVGQLCENRLGREIDHKIAQTAEGSPRGAIYLADKLLTTHCQEAEPPLLIEQAAWKETLTHWQADRERILGAGMSFGGEKGFLLKGQRIYFGGAELHLIDKDYLLLRRLIEAGGQVCPLRDLAAAGWPDEDPEGIPDKTVQEAIRRLKKRLTKQGADPDWMDAVRGRGYRLCVPAAGAAKKSKATGQKKPPAADKPPTRPTPQSKAVPADGKATPPSADEFSSFEAGLEELKRRLRDQPEAYEEALVYEARLRDNIAQVRRYGDGSERRSGRAEIIDRLNRLCREALSIDFNALCAQASAGGGGSSARPPRQRGRKGQDETGA